MPKIVECVPNFSEGKNKEVIDAISDAIRCVDGVSLLDVDPGQSTNRTVYTFLGHPDAVVEAALSAAKTAYKLIDMTKHKGEHPRMGALDVCPFIPVQGVEVEECIYCARRFGEKLAAELGVPVYLYGLASERSYRKTMPQIRMGEYEGLPEKLKKPEWQPDFGPAEFIPSWGASVTGVRKFLIAYNVNILSTKEQAHRIALNLREQGRGPNQPGRLKCVQGIGWWLDEANIAQISLNLTDHDVTPIHVAFEEARKDAQELHLAVTGSEIVGMVPLTAMLQAADYYIKQENLFIMDEDQKIHLVIDRLGLSTLHAFDPKQRIIEYSLPDSKIGPLASLTVEEFVRSVGARTAAPGGGSVAALVGALGSSLGAMVGQLTYGKRQWDALDGTMRRLIPVLHNTMKDVISLIDADTTAFNDYMAAMKLPQKTPNEEAAREAAMQAGLKKAVSVPLSLAMAVNSVWPTMIELAEVGNINCKSDLQVGARCLETSVWGAYYNVMINIDGIKDTLYQKQVKDEIEKEVSKAQDGCKEVLMVVKGRNE